METAYRMRLYILTALVLLGFGTLLQRLHKVQIMNTEKYRKLVPAPRSVTVREPGVRGEIHDRNGVILARNTRNYEVSINMDEVISYYKLQHANTPKQSVLVTNDGKPEKRETKNISAIVNEVVISRLRSFGLEKEYSPTKLARALEVHYATHGGLVPFPYRSDLTQEQFLRLAERNMEIPGVYINLKPLRQYPFNTLACHLLGYTKQWAKGEIPESDIGKYNHYLGDEMGKTGIELSMDKYLIGPGGVKTILKDEKNNTIGMTDFTRSQMGADVTLTIDARAQYLVENVLRKAGTRAAAVVMNVNTGEVIAMASIPNFNPNVYIPPTENSKIVEYEQKNTCFPLMNRAISSFIPGSTFKLATAIAGARAGLSQKSYTCNGYVTYGNREIKCWIYSHGHGKHGTLNISSAIMQSCNPYFMLLGNAAGSARMIDTFDLLNLGRVTGIELPDEKAGQFDGSATWKAKNQGAPITTTQLAQMSIGQASTIASPLQICAYTAMIANGGKFYQPRIVKRVEKKNLQGKREILVPDQPKLVFDLLQKGVVAPDLERIRRGMWMAANKPGGTANRVKLPNIEVAAKTGTAQVGLKHHNAWTTTFAPYENPKYAVTVLVEEGKAGGKVAGPLAHLIYRGLFAQDDGLRLPLKPQDEVKGSKNAIEEIQLSEDAFTAIEATEASDNTDSDENSMSTQETQETQPTHTTEPIPETDLENTQNIPKAITVPEE